MTNELQHEEIAAALRAFNKCMDEQQFPNLRAPVIAALDAYRATAQHPAPRRWLTTTEELEALRAGSIVRSKRGIVRERFSTGWLAVGGDGIATSEDLAMIEGGHELLHDGEADA